MLHKYKAGFAAFAMLTFIGASFDNAQAADTKKKYSASDPELAMKEVDIMDARYLRQTRRVCALGLMPATIQRIEADKEIGTKMPDVDVYCRHVVGVSQRNASMADLYIDLALQEQGYPGFDFPEQAQLLKNNEAWRTTEAILIASNAGQATYTGITGKSRSLPCPMALDAGAAWADGDPNAQVPVAMTKAAADAIAHQCYDPKVTQITVSGTAVPASKAGLIVGAWYAKNGF